MEAFNDTPLVNGTAYPTTTVDPKAYRYRILNAANDRFWNLSWYVADPRTGTLSEVALNPAELAAAQTDPVVFPTPDTTWSPEGPNWIQIGTEGGFLPAPVVVPAQPTTWITDPTRFDVGNVDQHSLLLAPAERADVIVDFSQFRGKTLILYNDAPAAFPARVPGYDYYTGGPDLSPAGAPTTLPGYGPNTRTIMQVKVSNAAPAVAFDRPNTTADRLGTLDDGLCPSRGWLRCVRVTVGPDHRRPGGLQLSLRHQLRRQRLVQQPHQPVRQVRRVSRESRKGHSQPTCSSSTPWRRRTASRVQIPLPAEGHPRRDELGQLRRVRAHDRQPRPRSARRNTAPTEHHPVSVRQPSRPRFWTRPGCRAALNVTPISSAADGTQIWKITHNGVDTHPIHFHLYNVQVINRVTWDNIIIPPDPTELGWKDTVRISPLEDTIVALRPIVPTLPFGVPDSIRPLNPMMPIGARGSQNGALRDGSRVQQHRCQRQPHRADRERDRQLRLGVRLALPHPEP